MYQYYIPKGSWQNFLWEEIVYHLLVRARLNVNKTICNPGSVAQSIKKLTEVIAFGSRFSSYLSPCKQAGRHVVFNTLHDSVLYFEKFKVVVLIIVRGCLH